MPTRPPRKPPARSPEGSTSGSRPSPPAAAAAIAVIPPLLVLAFSHGIGILIKAIGNAYAEYNELVNAVVASADATTETVAWQDEPIASVGEPILDSSAVGAVRKPDVVNDPSESAAGAYIETPVTLFQVHNVAPVAPAIAPVAPSVARVAPDVHDVAQPAAVAADYATSALDADSAPEEPEQTTEALLEFIEQAPGLSTQVRATARLKILDPDMTFAAIAELTGGGGGQHRNAPLQQSGGSSLRRGIHDASAARPRAAGFRRGPRAGDLLMTGQDSDADQFTLFGIEEDHDLEAAAAPPAGARDLPC